MFRSHQVLNNFRFRFYLELFCCQHGTYKSIMWNQVSSVSLWDLRLAEIKIWKLVICLTGAFKRLIYLIIFRSFTFDNWLFKKAFKILVFNNKTGLISLFFSLYRCIIKIEWMFCVYGCLITVLQYGMLLASWCVCVKTQLFQKKLFKNRFW